MEMTMEGLDLVSVIVPFLNGGLWLIEALQSVLAQTYTRWEMIVIDDGSQPYHSRLAKHFCSKHPDKIFYTEHEGHRNKGVSASRNAAAGLARGAYLAFLDADDKWLPCKLEKQLAYLKANPQASMTCEAITKWYSWQDATAADFIYPTGVAGDTCYAPGMLTTLLYPFTEAASPAPSGFLIKRNVFEKIGGFEETFHGVYELYEDQAFLAKMYLHEAIHIAGSANVMYRKREGSMCSAANDISKYNTVRAFFFDWLESYMDKYQLQDKHICRLLENVKKELACAQTLQAV